MKKFLAVLMIFCMLICTVSSVSASSGKEGAGGNIDFLKGVGIVQTEEIDGSEALSRMELAKMYYSVLTGSAIPEYSEYSTPYTDVSEKEAGYVKVVSDSKIMTGVGDGRFGLSETVTYVQLIKTMVTFLGYTPVAEAQGGWPYGYYSVANSLGLTQNAPSDMNVKVTFNAAADVFRLAADAELMVRSDYAGESYEIYKGNGYLEYYMNINLSDGIVTSNSTMSLGFDDEVEFGKVKLGKEQYAVSENAISIYDAIGRSVTAFVKGDGKSSEIVYYEVLENNVYEIDGKSIISVGETEIVYDEDGKEKKIKYDDYTAIIYNGTLAKSYTEDVINPFAGNSLDGKIIAIDNDGDKTVDVIMTEAYETFVCGGVRDMIATSDIIKGKQADFSDFGENTVAILNAIGEPIHPDDIVAGDVLNCFYDNSGKLTGIIVTIDSGKGKIEEVKTNGDVIESIVISGKEYECANSLVNYPDYDKLVPGTDVTVWFNKDLKIGAVKKGITDSEFALTVDFRKDKSLDGGYIIKLMETNGKFSTYTLADKVDINGNKVSAENFLDKMGVVAENGKIVRQVIKYSLDEAGKLKKVVVADNTKDENGYPESDFFVHDGFDGITAKYYRSDLYTFGLTHYVGSTSKIFVVPTEENRDNEKGYAVKNYGYFSNGNHTIIGYGINKYSPFIEVAVAISSIGASSDLDSASNFMAISKIVRTFSESGDEILRIDGFYSYSSSTAYFGSFEVASDEVLNVGKDGERVDVGDIIIYSQDASGAIDNIKLVLDKDANSLFNLSNPSRAYPGDGQRFAYGDVVCTDGKYVTLELKNTDGTVKRESYPVSRFENNAGLCTVNERTGDMSVKLKPKANEIYDRETYGDNCSKVFVFVKGPYWISAVVYND